LTVEDTDNVEQLIRETIVLPVIYVLVRGKAIIVLYSGNEDYWWGKLGLTIQGTGKAIVRVYHTYIMCRQNTT
jgi:hypothetical protein